MRISLAFSFATEDARFDADFPPPIDPLVDMLPLAAASLRSLGSHFDVAGVTQSMNSVIRFGGTAIAMGKPCRPVSWGSCTRNVDVPDGS